MVALILGGLRRVAMSSPANGHPCGFLGSGPCAALPSGSESNAPRPDIPNVPNMSCGKVYSPNWDNCVGVAAYPNGNIYRGEFHHGTREGFGFIVINAKGVSDNNNILSNEPSIYAGEFRGNKLNGHGVWFTNSGGGYSGTFVENIPQSDVSQKNCTGEPSSWSNCVAGVRYGNGNLYRGEFVNGHREGIGMIEIQATGRRIPSLSIDLTRRMRTVARQGRRNTRAKCLVA